MLPPRQAMQAGTDAILNSQHCNHRAPVRCACDPSKVATWPGLGTLSVSPHPSRKLNKHSHDARNKMIPTPGAVRINGVFWVLIDGVISQRRCIK